MSDGDATGGARDGRRDFIGRAFTWLGLGSLATSLVSSIYANTRFFFPKVLYEPPAKFKAGFAGDYRRNTVSDRWVKDHQVWMVRDEDRLYALSSVCTHLGCLTRFFAEEDLFKCPCHGSNFSRQGDPVAGPAPVPLYHLAISKGDDEQIVVDKTQRENQPGRRDNLPFVFKV
ncbi:MAG: ubiquinol-cytochrome c reductase iron-sulfur subunit [Pirellulaceae bacterium]